MTTQADCQPHHWLIETPNGPTSVGRCTLCRKVRSDFSNSHFLDNEGGRKAATLRHHVAVTPREREMRVTD